jgi:hypothetical protein
MNIFIDESGIFANPENKSNSVSVVAALIVPDNKLKRVEFEFIKLKLDWGFGRSEVKGSKLNEKQLSELFSMLAQYDCIAQIAAIDSGSHSEEDVSNHKREQAENIVADLTEKHQPGMIRDLHELKKKLDVMSNPLYLQSIATTTVVEAALRVATLFYALRTPSELGSFSWALDAKDKVKTDYEKWWSAVVVAFLQDRSFKKPFERLIGADYSHFKKYQGVSEHAPEYLRHVIPGDPSPFSYIDIKLILWEKIEFVNSARTIGIQLADIVATTVRRSFRGNLKKEGWLGLSKILINENPHAIHVLAIAKRGDQRETIEVISNYGNIVSTLSRNARSLWDGIDRDLLKRVEESQT